MDMDKSLIENCIQCGVCSSSCPFSEYMNHSPRKIIAIFLSEGKIPEDSNMFWLCSSCYSCNIKCPRGIPLADFIYLIKQNYSREIPNKYSDFYKIMYRNILKNRKLNEKIAFLEYVIKSNPFLGIKKFNLFLKLLIKKRL